MNMSIVKDVQRLVEDAKRLVTNIIHTTQFIDFQYTVLNSCALQH